MAVVFLFILLWTVTSCSFFNTVALGDARVVVTAGVAALKRKSRGKAKAAGGKLAGLKARPPLQWEQLEAESNAEGTGGGKKDPWSETMDMRYVGVGETELLVFMAAYG